jgi:CelD/BcsL family acetyltransferase involved in cellulose biosynthesis
MPTASPGSATCLRALRFGSVAPGNPEVESVKVTVVPGAELTPEHVTRWSAIHLANPSLASPYFAPEFVQVTASARDDVRVSILEDDAGVVGFFPFQGGSDGPAHPVAGRMSDFHGIIASDALTWDAPTLLRSSGLSGWRFDHLLASQEPLRRFHWTEAPSPYIDLADGFEAYRQQRKDAGSREIEQILYKARKAERRLGPLRFEFQASDEAPFAALLRWKAQQYRATGQQDITAIPWIVRFLDRIRHARGERFSGLMSALYIGDRLAAVHFGMRSSTVLHYWFPAYDPELAFFSPGQLCIIELARAAASQGVRRIDLGKGEEAYKSRLMSGSTPVAEGAVDLRPLVGTAGRRWFQLRNWARRSPLRRPLLVPARWLRRTAAARSKH